MAIYIDNFDREKNDKKTLLEHHYELADQRNRLFPEPEREGNCHEVHALVQTGL